MGFLQSVLFVECLCYNSDIIILPDNMKGSMAAGAGAVDTADRDALLETAVARARPETASMV